MFNPEKEREPQRHAVTARPKLVSEVMTREVKTLAPDQSFADVVSLLAGNNFHHIVVALDGYLKGVLSDRDVYRQLGRVGDWSAKKVGEIMTTNAFTISPETRLSDAAEQMLLRPFNCLPVVTQDGKLVGLLTSTDLIRLYKTLQKQLEAEL
jgi:CBS domain-containing protein